GGRESKSPASFGQKTNGRYHATSVSSPVGSNPEFDERRTPNEERRTKNLCLAAWSTAEVQHPASLRK
ncbi:MAG: hypothetical protein Q4E34_03180, partial [Synergistaceae bacterium]|nr:hypothetical protein [Synergistaceae bacterium]